jgi:hypothetical protein
MQLKASDLDAGVYSLMRRLSLNRICLLLFWQL